MFFFGRGRGACKRLVSCKSLIVKIRIEERITIEERR